MIPDPAEAMVTIPVRVHQGRPVYFFGEAFPALREGAVGELILRRSAVENPAEVRQVTASARRELFPAGTRLLAELKLKGGGGELLRARDVGSIDLQTGTHLAELVLLEDLFVTLRATKRATLRPCRVSIPAMNAEAGSLNEAYTIASREYESWRRSHTGNVFQRIHFEHESTPTSSRWEKLDRRRLELEVEYEREVVEAVGAQQRANS